MYADKSDSAQRYALPIRTAGRLRSLHFARTTDTGMARNCAISSTVNMRSLRVSYILMSSVGVTLQQVWMHRVVFLLLQIGRFVNPWTHPTPERQSQQLFSTWTQPILGNNGMGDNGWTKRKV